MVETELEMEWRVRLEKVAPVLLQSECTLNPLHKGEYYELLHFI